MIRIGVIGAGAWGINHVRAIASEPRCELAAVADPDPDALDRARAIAPRARYDRDADRVIADPEIDAIVVASPAPTHAALAAAVLHARKHLLVEKPHATTSAAAIELAAAASRAGVVGMVGHLMVYHPAVARLRGLLQSGSLGALRYLHSTRVNLGRIRTDENALWTFGSHDLSMFDFLLGRSPCSVAAHGNDDVVFVALHYAGGELAHLHLSRISPRKERRLILVCSQKMAELDDVAAEKLRIYDKGYDRPPQFTEYSDYLTLRDGDVHIPRIVMQEPLRVQLQHFLDRISDGRAPATDLDSGVRIVRVLEAAQASLLRDGVAVTIQNS